MHDRELDDLIQGWLLGTLDERQHAELERRLLADAEARRVFRSATNVDTATRDWASRDASLAAWRAAEPPAPRRRAWGMIVAAGLAAALVVFSLSLWLNHAAPRRESTDRGCAMLTQSAGVTWERGSETVRLGDTLTTGRIALAKGLVQIEFFSGAAVVLEGPAELEIVSSWEAICRFGRARVRVPPAANGFKLRAADLTLVDLGTEFAMDVDRATQGTRVHVFDGEVQAQRGQDAPLSLKRGDGLEIHDGSVRRVASIKPEDFVTGDRLQTLTRAHARTRFAAWEEFSKAQRSDPRLVAYYPMLRSTGWERRVSNAALPANASRDGGAVGATWAEGRWPQKDALEFKRPGDRVRLQINGRYEAITMTCWVRVDGLDRWFNGIFLTDGYGIGTPHWQIHDDGRLVFSLAFEAAGTGNKQNHAFRSPPFFDTSNTGRWHHLAVTCDTRNGTVVQFIDGIEVSRGVHPAHQFAQPLVLGGCELGNWGLPLADANYPVRNLNGRIDEFAIYAAVLEPAEIRAMVEAGRPD